MNKLIFILIFLPSIIFSQNITIKGTVLDSEQGKGVPFATISINNQHGFTNEMGGFEFDIPKSPIYDFEIQSIGYKKYASSYHRDDLNNLKIYLESSPITTEEVLVVASVPSAFVTSKYDKKESVSQPKNVGDLFRNINGFTVQKKGGYAMEPVFRAFKKEELNILYDGYIQLTHACPNRMDPGTTHVIPEEVKQVEMITGPFSVKFGPSFGGIVNIITESPANFKKGLSGSAEMGYDFNGAGKTGRLVLGNSTDKFDFYINGGIKDFGDYTNGNGTIVPSHFKSYDYAAKMGFKFKNNQRLQFQFRQSFGRDISHAGLPMDSPKDNSTIGAVSYKLMHPTPAIVSFEAKAYGTFVDHIMSNTLRPNFKIVEAKSPVTATTFGGKIELNLSSSLKNKVSLGLEYRYLGRDGSRTRFLKKNPKTKEDLPSPKTFVDKIWQNSVLNTSGFYVEDKYFLNGKWKFLTGVRLDYVKAEINDPAKDFSLLYDLEKMDSDINVSGTATVSFLPNSDLVVEFAIGRGVRSATLEERYINHFGIGKDPYELVGNPNLKPEANHQIELSFSKNSNKLKWSGNLFFAYITDYITPEIDTSIKRKYLPFKDPKFAKRFQNVDAVTQVGFETGMTYEIMKNLNLNTEISFVKADNLDWNEPLAQVAPMELNVGLRYNRAIWWAEMNSRFVRKQDRFSNHFGEGETPGFNVIDFNFGIEPISNLNLGFAVLNVFDTYYYEHLNWSFTNLKGYKGSIYERGRNVSLYAKYQF